MIRPNVLLLAALLLVAGCKAGGDADPAPAAQPAPLGLAAGAGLPLPDTLGVPLDLHILVDQFGYRPGDPKVAVIRSPRIGFDAADVFSPGAAYEVRRADDHAAAFAGKIVPWKGGSVQDTSGDVGWWFDFSSLNEPGTYYVYDVEKKRRSAAFRIDREVYRDVLKASVRTFFYQRSAFAKKAPYADACWQDSAAHVGPHQDLAARDITDPRNKARERDLSGGWFDAGDVNKYVSFIVQPVHQLLLAYRSNPEVFTDDFDIPESGNGIPDLIDEIRWGIDWLKKMQYADGSVAAKVGATKPEWADPPSSDKSHRYYVPGCTSATIAASGMFAHAAHAFDGIPQLKREVPDLTARAVKAFDAYLAAPVKQTDCDDLTVKWGDSDLPLEDQEDLAVVAAIYLYAATGSARYHDYLKANYRKTRPFRGFPGWTRYFPQIGESILYYTTLPKADPETRSDILAAKQADAVQGNQIYGVNDDDLYRNLMHTEQYSWGSHNVRAGYGNSNLDMIRYRPGPADTTAYRNRALDTLHYFHGVNPFGMVYLSNMYRYGATYSANEIFHIWFSRDQKKWRNARLSECGPVPGFVPGGPNLNVVKDGVPADIQPPAGQPAQKSYRDSGEYERYPSHSFTEPQLAYQGSYIRLLSYLVE
ncbi:MAG: glycoside hydrolase family 9 protein [Panacagrimonas sp.]